MSETETHRNKVALTAALLVALIALAGVGYAATTHTFTGETESVQQTIDTDYVVVQLNKEAYVDSTNLHAWWDTKTTHDGTNYVYKYKFSDADSYTITVTVDASDSAIENEEELKLNASFATGFSATGYTLMCQIGTGTATAVSGTAVISNYTINADEPLTITFTLEQNSSIEADSNGYITTEPADDVILPAITFTVTGTQPHA